MKTYLFNVGKNYRLHSGEQDSCFFNLFDDEIVQTRSLQECSLLKSLPSLAIRHTKYFSVGRLVCVSKCDSCDRFTRDQTLFEEVDSQSLDICASPSKPSALMEFFDVFSEATCVDVQLRTIRPDRIHEGVGYIFDNFQSDSNAINPKPFVVEFAQTSPQTIIFHLVILADYLGKLLLSGSDQNESGSECHKCSNNIASESEPLLGRRGPVCAPNRSCNSEPSNDCPDQEDTDGRSHSSISVKAHARNLQRLPSFVESGAERFRSDERNLPRSSAVTSLVPIWPAATPQAALSPP